MAGWVDGWMKGWKYGWWMDRRMDGYRTTPRSVPDGDFSPLVHPLISSSPFRESLWSCHGYSRCILRDGHIHPFYLSGEKKANLQISVRISTGVWAVEGRRWLSLHLTHHLLFLTFPTASPPPLGLVLSRVVAFLLRANVRVTECQGWNGPMSATPHFTDKETRPDMGKELSMIR